MFRPKIQKTRVLIIIAVLNISLVYWAANSGNQIESLGYEDKINATKIMEKYIDILKKHAESNTNYHVYDLYKTGLIGAKVTEITTIVDPLPPDKSIMIHSKVACTHPNFAAAIVDIFYDAGLKRGDNVAIGMSGSLPGANTSVLSACKAMGIKPYVISSVGSSSWGANRENFSWPEMENHLYKNGQIEALSIAYTTGGEYDIGGAQISDEGMKIIEGIIANIDADKFIGSPTYEDNINERMKRYNLNNISYSAYVNVGGGVASVGRGYEQDNYLGYVGWYDVNLENWNNSVAYEFLSDSIPLINIKNINKLSKEYKLYPPNNDFEINQGTLFFEDPKNLEDQYNIKIIIISLILSLITIISVGVYSHIEIKNRMKKHE